MLDVIIILSVGIVRHTYLRQVSNNLYALPVTEYVTCTHHVYAHYG